MVNWKGSLHGIQAVGRVLSWPIGTGLDGGP